MTHSAPPSSEAPAPSEPAVPSGQLLDALLSAAGLSVRAEADSAPASADGEPPPQRPAPAANR